MGRRGGCSEKRLDEKAGAAVSCGQQALGGSKGHIPEGVQATVMNRGEYEKIKISTGTVG